MPTKKETEDKYLDAWLRFHQAYKLVSRAEDIVYAEVGITTQQHTVLAAIESIYNPVMPSEVAYWLHQNPNGISMLINRMERDGLVKRLRDSRDRRTVSLVLTRKGKEILKRSAVAGWQLITKMMSELPEAELGAFITMLERLREVAFSMVSPGKTMREVRMQKPTGTGRVPRAKDARNSA